MYVNYFNIKSVYKDVYKDIYVNNISKDVCVNNKYKVYDDIYVININVNEYKGILLSNFEGKKYFIVGYYILVNVEVVEFNLK